MTNKMCHCGILSREECENGYNEDPDEHPEVCVYIVKTWVSLEKKKEIDEDYEEDEDHP